MVKIKISKKSLKRGGNMKSDWKNELLNKKNKLLKQTAGANFDNSNVKRLLDIKNMAPKDRYNALVDKVRTDRGKPKYPMFKKLLGKLYSLISVVLFLTIVFFTYIIGYALYKKYIERNEKYVNEGLVECIRLSLSEFMPNLESVFKVIYDKIALILFGGKKNKEIIPLVKKEVYNVGRNKYTYKQAKKVCELLGGKLATKDQVYGAYNGGAEWCNYGWTQGQYALFPTQKKTYDMLVAAGRGDECGKPGVNGGYFSDETMKFGVNCYGPKPNTDENNIEQAKCPNPLIEQSIDKNTGMYSMTYKCPVDPSSGGGGDGEDGEVTVEDIEVLPFNNHKWSITNNESDVYKGDNSISRNINDALNSGFEPINGISRTNLLNSMTQIHQFLTDKTLLVMLKQKMGDKIKSLSTKKLWNLVAAFVLSNMKVIFAQNNIDSSKKSSGKMIEDAVKHYDSVQINDLDLEIKKVISRDGINDIVRRLKME